MNNFLRTKTASIILVLLLVTTSFFTVRMMMQKSIIDKEIAKLESQMSRIKNDTEQLSSLVQYLNTPQYQEREAREKLNLSKEGEYVVVLPQGDVAGDSTNAQTSTPDKNYELWYNYFFENVN